jgi:hypothetical protein
MDLHRIDENKLRLELQEKELLVLFSCVREAFAYLHRNAFSSRIGAPYEEVSQLADELMGLIERESIDL